MKKNKILKSLAGFSLIEVMVSVGIFSILAMAISSVMFNGLKTEKMIERKTSATDFRSLVGMQLGAGSTCDKNFAGRHLSNGMVAPISALYSLDNAGNIDPTKPIAVAPGVIEKQITLVSMTLKTTLIAPNNYRGDIKMRFSSPDFGEIERATSLVLQTDAADNVTNCYSGLGNVTVEIAGAPAPPAAPAPSSAAGGVSAAGGGGVSGSGGGGGGGGGS